MSKCFCHLNGYEVKDAKARDDINLINEDIENNVKTSISNLETDIENNVKTSISNLETGLNKIALFGDSWTDPTSLDAIWGTLIGGALNLTTHNYAKSGAYMSGETETSLKSQVDTFLNEDIEKTKVKYIVVLGGVNDFRNNVAWDVLAEGLETQIARLKTSCPQAKIVYVSNCQYYYSKEQGDYWCGVHQQLRYAVSIPTLNLFGTMGNEVYNSNNYFHLTQVGQRIMMSNIIALLTGGEIQHWQDTIVITNDTAEVKYSTQRVNNMVHIIIELTPKTATDFYTINSSLPFYLNYYGERIGIVGRAKEVGIVNISHNAIAFDFETALTVNEKYRFITAIPLEHK